MKKTNAFSILKWIGITIFVTPLLMILLIISTQENESPMISNINRVEEIPSTKNRTDEKLTNELTEKENRIKELELLLEKKNSKKQESDNTIRKKIELDSNKVINDSISK
jgi:hypothetical protein